MINPSGGPVAQYFSTVTAALSGLETYLSDPDRADPGNPFPPAVILPYLARFAASLRCWENRIGFTEHFRISRAESGFPVFQNVLELEKDRNTAAERLAAIPDAQTLRAEMADFILRNRAFPEALQSRMAERIYLESLSKGEVFSPVILPETVHVGVNRQNGRPVCVVVWGAFDGSQTLPMIYIAVIEDSSDNMVKMLVRGDGTLDPDIDIPLPVGGLLNPEHAARFDDFITRNSSYALTPATIAANLDRDFPTLHPKQLRRFVLGPFYSAGITENNDRINGILSKVRRSGDAWLLTWTQQEVFSSAERPAERGFFSSTPARQEFHIDTSNLEAARMGVSTYQKHALVPHEAYQALYAAGETASIFGDYKVHVISGNQVISEV